MAPRPPTLGMSRRSRDAPRIPESVERETNEIGDAADVIARCLAAKPRPREPDGFDRCGKTVGDGRPELRITAGAGEKYEPASHTPVIVMPEFLIL